MSDVCVVVPTIRETSILKFLDVWDAQLADVPILIVEDNPEKTFPLERPNVIHYAWKDIDAELGDRSWIIPRRTDCVRSYGYYKAWQRGAKIVITLDDDCYPASPDYVATHRARLTEAARQHRWISSGTGLKPRGMPYQSEDDARPCALNHGLWTNVPDFDAITQLLNGRLRQDFAPVDQVIPPGMYFPMCGMNIAFTRDLVPAMYFLLMGRDWQFDRFGDIWCGVLMKKVCDHLGLAVTSGGPLVEHQRASNVWVNLKKELPGYEVNETLWQAIDRLVLTRDTVAGCYREIAEKLPLEGAYWDKLREAMKIWTALFEHA